MTIAEIIAEGERQNRNYTTMILPNGDARTLLAVAKAAVEVLADHDERVRLYPQYHNQPHKVKVMEALRAAVRGEGKEKER